jgi:hypothetical protein
MGVMMAVLIVTSKFFFSAEYCRMIVKVSSISLSPPRLFLRKPVTEEGVPKRSRA